VRDAYPTRYWHALEDGRVQCDLCPRYCKLHEGQRGFCFVRANFGGAVVLTTYGRSSGFCIDPIEKKPLNHFLPGTPVLSFGTAGCNLGCKFCQNWDISKSREIDTLADEASPETIAHAAADLECRSVAFTYNDPVIFHEYAIDVAKACHARGLQTVAVTAGEICPEPRREFFEHMDAANVDLKAFTDEFYSEVCAGHLEPVLDTLRYLKHETDVWFETTTLLIPGLNDSEEEIDEMTSWVVRELGPDVPMHFTAFHPDWRMLDRPPTRERRALRVHRQRRGSRGRHDALPRLRGAADRAGRLRDPRLGPRRGGRLPAMRDAVRGGLRTPARPLGLAPHAGPARGVPVVIRAPEVAGMFYPDDPAELRSWVRTFIGDPEGAGARAVVAPHAGYVYSGPIAGSAYRRVGPRFRRVILIGPAHRYPLRGLATHSATHFATPLGDVPVRHPAGVPALDEAHRREHSLEVHLPFLQVVLGDFELVPVLVGEAEPDEVATVLELADDDTLIVVSSDLSHFLPYDEARRRDAETVRRIEAGYRVGPYDACGCYSIGGLTELARRRGWSGTTVDLRNSGDTAGDRDSVVGYAAIVY